MKALLLSLLIISCAGCAAVQDDCTFTNPAGRTPAQRVVGDLIVAPVAAPVCLLSGFGQVELAKPSQPFIVQGLGSGSYTVGQTTCVPLNDANGSFSCY